MWLLLLFVLYVDGQYVNVSDAAQYISNPCTDKNHLFLAPGVLTAGISNRACVSRFYPHGTALMMLALVTEDKRTTTASRELPSGDGGCLDISVPQLPNTKAELIVTIRYPGICAWEKRMSLRVSGGRVVVIQSERARYRPGETLRLRILALKADLTPAHGTIDEVWIEGPHGAWEGSRVWQWTGVRTRLGIAQLQYDIDELAPPGQWTIRARLADGSQGSTALWVGNYELPPFQLSVRHAPKVLRTSDRIVWTVCVRYPWTEAVEGMIVIRLRGAGGGADAGVRTALRLRAPRACHRHAAAARRLGLTAPRPPLALVADFSFQEDGTRVWQNTTVVSLVVDSPITLQFLTKHRAVISPGLPYKLKVKAIRWDDKPASSVAIRVCRHATTTPASVNSSPTSDDVICAQGSTDDSGVARVMFSAVDDQASYYQFEAQLTNDSTTTASLHLPVSRTAGGHAALGPLRADSRAARTFVPLYLNLNNISSTITVHFVVITRGGIIYRWGATTQCPTSSSSDQIRTAPINTRCDVGSMMSRDNPSQHNTSNASDLLDGHLLRVMLPIKVTHQMCPDSHLIAYFYHNGELISASKHFEMDECFVTKVEATWLSRQTLPGSQASLQLTTQGPALCALTALDTAAKWSQHGSSIKDVLVSGLKKMLEAHRNLTEYDAAGECFYTFDTPEVPTSSIELTSMWLAAAGVRVTGGDRVTSRRCIPMAPASLISEDAAPRSDFSEAWLWRLLAVGTNGSAVITARAPDSITRFEASAVCVSKTGVAVSQPAVLQVFREFFIHADGPKRLRRGDAGIVRYRIFNYLYEPLSIKVSVTTDARLESLPREDHVCVAARASSPRRLELKARQPGETKLVLKATSVSQGCGNGTTSRSGVSDEVIIKILVEPEGMPVQDQKSALLCGRGSAESGKSEVSWSFPPVQAVPGTETLTVWTTSDVIGPLLADSDSLVLLPRGCGEQNMARLATNLLALSQLHPKSAAASIAREHVARGFTRQLQYTHPAGGFSAFGPGDSSPSTWLTAFSIRYMRRAHKALWPSLQAPPALDTAERWLLNQQMENGCFRNEGQVFHRELRGGLNEDGEIANVALTAYVITSLLESTSPLPSRLLHNSLACLRALPLKANTSNRVYAHALLAYALVNINAYEGQVWRNNEALMYRSGLEGKEVLMEVLQLIKLAKKSEDYVWWETGSLTTSIEATGYALLALRHCAGEVRAAAGASGALRWLHAHRSASGGFMSTQDTLVAMEALTSWSSLLHPRDTNLTLWARTATGGTRLTLDTYHVPHVLNIHPGEKLSVAVEGTGCALVQATRRYNSVSPAKDTSKRLSAQVSVHTDGPFDCDHNRTTCYCAAVIEACAMWSGPFPEMALLEVTLPGGFGLDAALVYKQLNVPGSMIRRIEVSTSGSKAAFYLSGHGPQASGAHSCVSLPSVGPRAKTKPAYVHLTDYYNTDVNDTQVYTIPEDCPPRIAHDPIEYMTSDNLYNEAKSLSDSGEILITHEYSFEDIPEGIPLEDPLYDNLTMRETDESELNTTNSIMNEAKSQIDKDTKRNNESNDVANLRVNDRSRFAVRDGEYNLENKHDSMNSTGHLETHQEYKTGSQNVSVDSKNSLYDEPKYTKNLKRFNETIQESASKSENLIDSTKYETITGEDKLENPKLSDFHVIDSEKDLEVPDGVEGPVPSIMLPPENFVSPPNIDMERLPSLPNIGLIGVYPTDSRYRKLFNRNAHG